ncbi:MAG: hypothetical protein Q9162_000717 [Coniocarpon cinnabarinum]
MAAGRAATGQIQQVRIQLSSQHDDLQLPEQPGPILVPTSLRRQDLSAIVNELLETESRIPLEFFVKASPLRISLDEWLAAHGTSTEEILDVEYARAQLPPRFQSSFQHDDWIGAIDVLSSTSALSQTAQPGHERILSGSYDGSVLMWNMSGQCIATSEGAEAPDEHGNRRLADGRQPMLITAKFLSPSQVVASGWRSYLRIWDFEETADASTGGGGKFTPSLDLHGHRMAVNDLAVHDSRILSASTDSTAMLWRADAEDAPEADTAVMPSSSSNKRRKLNHAKTQARGPLNTLAGHTAKVTGVVFHSNDASVAYTAAQDSTVRTWDLETAQAVQSKTPGGPHTPHRCIHNMKELGLVATGTDDRRIILMDPREDAVRQSVGTLMGHHNAVVALDSDPESQYGIASASHDGCVRIWDIRVASDPVSEKRGSTYKIPRTGSGNKCDRIPGGEGVRLHAMRWDRNVGIVSGGVDKRVQIDKCGRS